MFLLFFIYSLFLLTSAAQVLLQAGDKSCDRDRRERERQSGDAIPSYLFILQANAQVLNHLTSRFPDVPSVCLSLSLPHSQILINCPSLKSERAVALSFASSSVSK